MYIHGKLTQSLHSCLSSAAPTDTASASDALKIEIGHNGRHVILACLSVCLSSFLSSFYYDYFYHHHLNHRHCLTCVHCAERSSSLSSPGETSTLTSSTSSSRSPTPHSPSTPIPSFSSATPWRSKVSTHLLSF